MVLLRGLCSLLCMQWASAFFSPWNSYIAGLRSPDPAHAQILRPRGATQAEDLHRFVARSLVKRSPDTEELTDPDDLDDVETSEDEEARRGQVSFSITADFQALQQKLMRELWSRSRSSSNRDVVARSRILRSEG